MRIGPRLALPVPLPREVVEPEPKTGHTPSRRFPKRQKQQRFDVFVFLFSSRALHRPRLVAWLGLALPQLYPRRAERLQAVTLAITAWGYVAALSDLSPDLHERGGNHENNTQERVLYEQLTDCDYKRAEATS